MKKVFLTICIICATVISVIAQNLKVIDLLSMYKKATWEDVNTFVTNKGWVFFDAKEATEIQWSYKKSDYNDKAQCWLVLKLNGSLFESIRYSVSSQVQYTNLVSQAKLLGFKKMESRVIDGAIISEFSNGKYVFSAWITKNTEDNYGASQNYYQVKMEKIRTSIFDDYVYREREKAVDESYEETNNVILSLYVGQKYQGGIIAYIDETGQHGLIAAPTDNGQLQFLNAKISCGKLYLDGYNGWRMPNVEELKILYQNRILIGGFIKGNYWSSEGNSFDFWSGEIDSQKYEYNFYYIRAVRKF